MYVKIYLYESESESENENAIKLCVEFETITMMKSSE